MRGWQLLRHGGPDAQAFRDDLEVPEPGAGELRIRVAAAGLNNTDVWSREGAYGTPEDPNARAGWLRVPLAFPRIQGGDIAGFVDAVGPGVPGSRRGARVVVNPVLYGHDRDSDGLRNCRLIGSERDGGFAEYVTVPAENAVPVQTGLSDTELAALPIAYLTAERMLGRAGVTAGETVLVTGASGGVGTALVQLAVARGGHVIAIAGETKRAAVAALGAAAVVPRERFERDGPSALPDGPESVAVVADVVAGPALGSLLNALTHGGRYVIAGAIAGPQRALDLRTVYLKQLTLLGSTLGTREDFARLVRHVEQGRLRPPVAAMYALEALPAAQAQFGRKDFVGNIVLEVPGTRSSIQA